MFACHWKRSAHPYVHGNGSGIVDMERGRSAKAGIHLAVTFDGSNPISSSLMSANSALVPSPTLAMRIDGFPAFSHAEGRTRHVLDYARKT